MDIYELYMDISEAIEGAMPAEAELICLDADDRSPWELQLIDRDWSYVGHNDSYESIQEQCLNKWKYINARNRVLPGVMAAFIKKADVLSELLDQSVGVITETDTEYFGEEKDVPIGFSLTINQALEDIPSDGEPFDWNEETTKRIANGGPVSVGPTPASGGPSPDEDDRDPEPWDEDDWDD